MNPIDVEINTPLAFHGIFELAARNAFLDEFELADFTLRNQVQADYFDCRLQPVGVLALVIGFEPLADFDEVIRGYAIVWKKDLGGMFLVAIAEAREAYII